MDTPTYYIDCMLEDAFAYRSRKLLDRIKMDELKKHIIQCEKDRQFKEAA